MGVNKSKRYDRYFEGYEEAASFDENGKRVIKVQYTGQYYSPALSPGKRRTLRIVYVVLFAAVCALEILGGSLKAASNYTNYMFAAQGLTLAVSIALLTFLISNVTAPLKMEISRYKTSHVNFKGLCMITSVFLFGTFICAVIGISSSALSAAGAVSAAGYLAASVCCLVMWNMERKVKYITE